MISTRFKLDKLVIGSSFTLGTINSVQANFNTEVLTNYPAGHIAPMCIANLSQRPQFNVTTPDLATTLAAVPVNGLATTSDSYLYQKKATDTGSVARATTTHTRYVVSVVTVYWSTITLPNNGEGTVQLMVNPVWDGTNDIIVMGSAVALSGNLACDARYGCGPVSINGTSINGIQSIEVTSGAAMRALDASSEIWPSVCCIDRVAPVVRIVTTDIQAANLGVTGTALDGSNGLVFWGRKHKVADATTAHIKFIGLNGIAHVESESGDSAQDYQATIVVQLSSASDSVMPLTYTTGQAIA